jgi:hypothetical protein
MAAKRSRRSFRVSYDFGFFIPSLHGGKKVKIAGFWFEETDRAGLSMRREADTPPPGGNKLRSRLTSPKKHIRMNGIGHSTTPRIDDVLEKLYCTTANNVFDGLEKILMTARSQDTL